MVGCVVIIPCIDMLVHAYNHVISFVPVSKNYNIQQLLLTYFLMTLSLVMIADHERKTFVIEVVGNL